MIGMSEKTAKIGRIVTFIMIVILSSLVGMAVLGGIIAAVWIASPILGILAAVIGLFFITIAVAGVVYTFFTAQLNKTRG